MDGRRSQRHRRIDTSPPKIVPPKTVPLASYGIKIYGRNYQKWPSRYSDVFNKITEITADSSALRAVHTTYRHVMKTMGIDTDPFAVDNENLEDNIELARNIQQRAIRLYQQSFGEKGGPSEDEWRMEIEGLVLGHLGQNLVQDEGESSVIQFSVREFNTKDFTPTNRVQSPTSTPLGCVGSSGATAFTYPQGATTNSSASLYRSLPTPDIAQQERPAESLRLNNQQQTSKLTSTTMLPPSSSSSNSFNGMLQRDSRAPPLPSCTRSSSYCSTSLNEQQPVRYFASAINRYVLEDDLGVNAPQEKKKPDRIIGLVTRNNIYASTHGPQRVDDIYHQHVRNLMLERGLNLSPFKEGDFGSLVLPFAILEAKNGVGTYWPELERQTALPVAKYLRLQINLQEAAGFASCDCNTLVWMLGSIGPEWHVYGCYAVWYKHTKEWRYKIVQLASMDIRVEREALGLLDIIDAVSVWALAYRQRVIEAIQKLQTLTISDDE